MPRLIHSGFLGSLGGSWVQQILSLRVLSEPGQSGHCRWPSVLVKAGRLNVCMYFEFLYFDHNRDAYSLASLSPAVYGLLNWSFKVSFMGHLCVVF